MEKYVSTPEIRKGLIRNLMFQLYSDARTIYREYVQNALDSINSAVKSGVLQETKDGNVQININTSDRTVIIKDNGIGISEDIAVKTLLNISAQNKDGVNQAGQFGIGRLVGGGYFSKLIFRTSAINEKRATEVVFDVKKIWKMLNNDTEDYLATYVIKECTIYDSYDVPSESHFFEVELNSINEDRDELLDKEAIESYLNEVAPVDFKSEFKNTIVYNSLQNCPSFKDLYNELPKVQIFLGNKKIQKQYGLKIEGTSDKINNLEFFEIKTQEYGLLAWGWFALTKYTIQIPKTDNLCGIRLRKHNIQIGDSNLLSDIKLWKEPRGNSYFYGEIFIVHPKIEPVTARDGLAPSPETNSFYEELKKYFSELKNLYVKANQAKKSVERIIEGIKRIKQIGKEDYKAKDLIENRGVAAFEKFKSSTQFEPAKRMLKLYETDYLQATEEVKSLLNSLNQPNGTKENETSSTPSDADTTVAGEFEKPSTKPEETTDVNGGNGSPTNPSPKDSLPSNTPSKGGNKKDEDEEHTPSATEPLTKEKIDIEKLIAPLKNKGSWDENEIWIIKRALSVLYRNFPAEDSEKKLVKTLMELIVEEFSS